MVAAAAAVSMLSSGQAASASSATTPAVVRSTMWAPPTSGFKRPGVLTFSPNVVKRGTIVLKIRNRAGATYNCEVNLVSKLVRANQVVEMTVVFKRRGIYNASCGNPLDPEGPGIAGLLRVT